MNDSINVVVSIAVTNSENIRSKTSDIIDHGAIYVFTSTATLSIKLVTKNSNLFFKLLDAIAMSALTVFNNLLNL